MADEKRREEEKRRSGVKLSFPKLNFIIPKEVDIVLSETVHQSIAVARIVFVVVVAVVVYLLLIVVVVNHSTSQSYRHRRPSVIVISSPPNPHLNSFHSEHSR